MDHTLRIIKEEVGSLKNRGEAKVSKVNEKSSVRSSYEEFGYPISVEKLGIGIKLDTSKLGLDALHQDLYLMMISTLLFGASSLFRERVRNMRLLSNFYSEWEKIDKYHTFYIMASSENPKELLNEIEKELDELSLDEESFKRMKKVWIANEVKMIDDIDSTVHNLFDDYLKYNEIVSNKIDVIRNMDYETLLDVVKSLDFTNRSVVIMKSNETTE